MFNIVNEYAFQKKYNEVSRKKNSHPKLPHHNAVKMLYAKAISEALQSFVFDHTLHAHKHSKPGIDYLLSCYGHFHTK